MRTFLFLIKIALNGENSFITRCDNYDRNHGPIQNNIGTDHRVTVDGKGFVSRTLSLAIDQLVNDFPQARVTCTLQSAGNRRHAMRTRIKEVWGGPRVRDILLAAGAQDHRAMGDSVRLKHVHFANYGGKTQADEWYGGSIPFDRAMDPAMDVILAVKVRIQHPPYPSPPLGDMSADLLLLGRR
ncbi:uncharacterized protein Z519_06060 [Cladophialophora bantiana CBS 173.52]|uniref:Oxidoreductase molybdopterin-binding domain-containing protein n=1 Tax=Cladophialophora bantiana (strain ATCC 10958 / CBS 173.52 / CDC B-1940 / NIH 8579) TaxID=1442370 RepID=A0A0D2HRJ4_CLAB1|nr:uncharacterized protein Z519_06060 [Cladophialophora bantiana CBS 173.52]KIW93455.1 hypothetical protein Z519_06060 [Cladophialophora bantiana CBS 173.52]